MFVVVLGVGMFCFGGLRDEENKSRIEIDVEKGDVMLVFFGVVYVMIEDKGGFSMVGSYLIGVKNWDMCIG